MSIEITFVDRPKDGRFRRELPANFGQIMEALLSSKLPTGWADLKELLPIVDVREAFLRKLRRRAVIATSGSGRYVRILKLKTEKTDDPDE